MLTAQIIYAFVIKRRAPGQVETGACPAPGHAHFWSWAPPCRPGSGFFAKKQKEDDSKSRRSGWQKAERWKTGGKSANWLAWCYHYHYHCLSL